MCQQTSREVLPWDESASLEMVALTIAISSMILSLRVGPLRQFGRFRDPAPVNQGANRKK